MKTLLIITSAIVLFGCAVKEKPKEPKINHDSINQVRISDSIHKVNSKRISDSIVAELDKAMKGL